MSIADFHASPAKNPVPRRTISRPSQTRFFHDGRELRANEREEIVIQESSELENEEVSMISPPEDELVDSIPPPPSTPWYLQVESPTTEQNPLLERQKAPDLPADPPPLLSAIQNHVLTDLGLDDLKLLDLRKIDPPPALGANLLMLIATARSEKHLHVSADRFRKWMRTTHKISARTDGLIGRGELKLKLRRKARRARILSRVGSVETGRSDDGLSTGWICVTIDGLEDGRPVEELPEDDNYIGFGSRTGGVKMVIQMLTQDRREELDLESLWNDVLWRHERKELKLQRALEEMNARVEADNSLSTGEQADPSYSSSPPPLARTQSVGTIQIRNFHTQSAYQVRGLNTSNHDSPLPGDSVQDFLDGDFEDPKRDPILGDFRSHMTTRNARSLKAFLVRVARLYPQQVMERGETWANENRLQQHLTFLRELTPEAVEQILGHGGWDKDLNPFIRSFRRSLPLFPSVSNWTSYLNLICFCIDNGFEGYSKDLLDQVFRRLQASQIDLPNSLYVMVLSTLLEPPQLEKRQGIFDVNSEFLIRAAEILEDMSFRGHDIGTNEIRTLFEVALSRALGTQNDTGLALSLSSNLGALLREVFGPARSLELEVLRLHACADVGYWDGAWKIWRDFAAEFRRRPSELYSVMLERIAETGHRAKVLKALRIIVPDMDSEQPPVILDGDIADAIKACLRVVEPEIDDLAAADWSSNDELFQIWRRCEMVKQDQNQFLREFDDD